MPPNRKEGRRRQRDQHQIARIRRDGRNNADKHKDIGQQLRWRDDYQLADKRLHQAGFFRNANPNHGNNDHTNRVEAHEIGHHAGEHEADAINGQQATCRRCGLFDLAGLGVIGLIRHLRAEQRQQGREQHHKDDQIDKDHHRMRHAVAHALHRIQQALHDGFGFVFYREIIRRAHCDNASRIRAQDRMPFWKLSRLYFSFGL